MFESLSEKLSGILDKLTGRGALSEEDVNAAMREVRRALLEADVALEVVRSFVDRTRTKAVGAAVIKSVKPGQMVVKIVHDSLVETLGGEAQAIDLNAPAPVAIMLVGLQGAGKTTTAAKIAKRLTERDKRQGADGLARREAPGGAGAARGARRAGRRRDAADRVRRGSGRHRQTRRERRAAAGLRRRDPRHRRAHPYRRAADAGDGGDPRRRAARTRSCWSPTR